MAAGRLHPAPVWSDLASFDARAWRGAVDCVLSGDPCQPNSVAGKRGGEGDERWLLDRVIDIFDQSGAHTLFRENVTGNADGQLAVAIPALERLGCRVAVGIFSAGEAGASHRRERLFILAHRDSRGTADQHVNQPECGCAPHARSGCQSIADTSGQRICRASGNSSRAPCQDSACGSPGINWRADDASRALEHAARLGRGEGWAEHGVWGGRDAAADASGALADANGRIGGDRDIQRGGEQRLQPQGNGPHAELAKPDDPRLSRGGGKR